MRDLFYEPVDRIVTLANEEGIAFLLDRCSQIATALQWRIERIVVGEITAERLT